MSITEEMFETYSGFLGIEVAALKAVVDVESLGYGFDPVSKLMIIRWEGHKFRKFLNGDELKRAEKEGLAYKYSNRHKHPQPKNMRDRHRLLMEAMAINHDAALMSISMGMGQVMGFHYKALGFSSVQEMFDVNSKDLDGQLSTMVRYIDAFGLKDELRNLDWAGFAAGYNGADYKVNEYDKKLEKAYRKHGGGGVVKRGLIIKLGAQGQEVRGMQRALQELGYPINPDGFFGQKTKSVVKLFQMDNGLKVDGIVGSETFNAIESIIPDPKCETEKLEELKKQSDTTKLGGYLKTAGGVVFGTGAIAEGVSLMDGLTIANSFVSAIRPILNLISENIILFIIAVGAVAFMLGHRFILNDLRDKIEGKKL